LFQNIFGYENQRVIPRFLSIPEFAYTFAYTPALTTLRAPVYIALPWVSALIMDLTMGLGSRNRNDFNRLVVVEALKKHYTPTTHRRVFHGV
jgi:hypothetical protein